MALTDRQFHLQNGTAIATAIKYMYVLYVIVAFYGGLAVQKGVQKKHANWRN